MATTVDPLRLRKLLGPDEWSVPRVFGPNGWALVNRYGDGTVIVSADVWDGVEWVHASMTRSDRVPSYSDLCRLHHAAFPPHGWSYQVFPPKSAHVNVHENALHLWGRADGRRADLPDFGSEGTI